MKRTVGPLVILVCVVVGVLYLHSHSGKVIDSGPRTRNLKTVDFARKAAFEDAKLKLKKLLSLIYNRYEFGGQYGNKFFMTSNNISPETWDILKMKLAVKLLTPNATFLATFSGSSVTAAHDSYFAQGYPMILQKRMGDIFSAVGVALQVHDIAQGANNCSPYVLCYESMGGSDPDFINWEQSYNCGHDEGVFEATARTAGMSANKGIVYYSASGAWSPGGCPASTDKVPYCAEEWTPETAGLPEWDADEEAVQEMKQTLFLFNQDKPSYARFTGPFRSDYTGVGMMGFNVWEQNNHCRFVNPKSGHEEACNGIDSVEGCKMKFMTKEAGYYGSDNQQGANWHPTRAFHMLRGEAIAWIFGLVMLETVREVEEALMQGKSEQALRKDYADFLNDLTPPLPNAKKCEWPYHCEQRPLCFTDYKPHYSRNMTMTELVVGTTKWEYDAGELGEWSLHYGYLDAKPLYLVKGSGNGELFLKIHIGQAEHFWLCGNAKESLQYIVVQLDANVAHKADLKTTYVPSASRTVLTKFTAIGNECRQYDELPRGTHVIGVATDPAQPDHISALTHVIMWP